MARKFFDHQQFNIEFQFAPVTCMTELVILERCSQLPSGYNVVIFDGPGQQSMLFERGVPFRHDWANSHCEPLARSLLEQRMFDWLDETLGTA